LIEIAPPQTTRPPPTRVLFVVAGPGLITLSMIEALYKYNSGRRTFACVPSKTLSVSIDAITIKNSLWQQAKK